MVNQSSSSSFDPFAALADAGSDESTAPQYLAGASTHTLLNSYQSPEYSLDERVANIGKFAVGAMFSGIDSLANTAITGYNFFGSKLSDDFEKTDTIDTAAQLSDIDSNLGTYYTQNKQGIDLAGFLVTSLIPGMAGIKALNVGQKFLTAAKETGLIGANISRVTGLLTPNAEMYLAKAGAEIAQTQTTLGGINANLIKGIASGYGQAALESAAFEIAVTTTMSQSPVLEGQDIGDLTANILIGTALGGTIGGVFNTAKAYGFLKREVKAADLAEKPFTHITELPTGVGTGERLVQRFEDLNTIPTPPSTGDFATKFTRLAGNKEQRLQNLIREDIHSISSDPTLANMVADNSIGMSTQDATNAFFGVKEFTRIGQKTAIEKELEKSSKVLVDLDNPQIPATTNTTVKYVRLLGEDAGEISSVTPATYKLADRFPSGEEAMKYVQQRGFKLNAAYDSGAEDNHYVAEARFLWANKVVNLKDGATVGDRDIPLLEKAFDDGTPIKLRDSGIELTRPEDIFSHLQQVKHDVIQELVSAGKLSTDEISKITNVKRSYIEGDMSPNIVDDLFAQQSVDKLYTKQLVAAGRWDEVKGIVDTSMHPSWAKLGVDFDSIADVDGNLLSGMAYIKASAKLTQQQVDNVVANQVGPRFVSRFPQFTDEMLLKTNRYGAGSGRFSFANGNYGSTESIVEQVGAVTSDLVRDFKAQSRDVLEPVAAKLANAPQAAIEFQAINERLAGTAEKYVLSEEGTSLIPRKLAQYYEAVRSGAKGVPEPTLQHGAPVEIPIVNRETIEAVQAHIKVNGDRISALKEIRAAQGFTDEKDAATFYPMRPDPKDYKHFAFVKDSRVTGVGHMSMIHAGSADDLSKLIDLVPSEFQVITKAQSEDYHRALGDYKWDSTLHENYIDSSLQSAGINSQFFVKTDPVKIAKDWVESHLKYDGVHARELVSAKYDRQFEELRRLAEQHSNISSSQYASKWSMMDKETKNPYLDYLKTALNVSRVDEYPLLKSLNKVVTDSVGGAYDAIATAFKGMKKVEDLDKMQSTLDTYGIKSAFNHNAMADLIVNKNLSKSQATTFIRRANGLLSTLTLRLDSLNAVNNAIGANVLLGSETRSVISNIMKGNAEAVGDLSKLLDIKVPGVTDTIRSPAKLIANSMKTFFDRTGQTEELKALYRSNGWMPDLERQINSVLDDLTISPNDTGVTAHAKLSAAFAKTKEYVAIGEKVTGNKLAEDFNRFVAADVMRQITDVAVKHGVLPVENQASYITSFVNRTQGNILATQRPMLFQGPIGQAVGLFQTYQFNMIQQLLRHVSEGSAKDVATLLGLQSTLYGINGLPGFNFINTHIVGTSSGNAQHTDFYTSVYGMAGKQMGDWLLYGAPSNLLHANLYTRGDINPRQVTIIPTNPADIPVVNATASFYNNLKTTFSRISNGGAVWQSLLQGVEHNTLSRPLAGLAQTLQAFDNPAYQAFATSKAGNIMGSNDLFSLATIARLAGGKPLDEAILNDAMFRTTVYDSKDLAAKKEIGEAIKTTGMQGNTPNADEMNSFLQSYSAVGGSQKEFNKWALQQITTANKPKADGILKSLAKPSSRYLQVILTGSTFDKLPPSPQDQE